MRVIEVNNLNTTADIDEVNLSKVEDVFQIIDALLKANKTLLAIYAYKKYFNSTLNEASAKVTERSNLFYQEELRKIENEQ